MKDDDNDWKKERGLYVEAFRGPFFSICAKSEDERLREEMRRAGDDPPCFLQKKSEIFFSLFPLLPPFERFTLMMTTTLRKAFFFACRGFYAFLSFSTYSVLEMLLHRRNQ